MSNIETVIETLKGLFEGQTYTEEERSRIAGYVKNTLEVPGTIWSLEDFEDVATEELTDEERDKVCREAYNSKSNDLHESDWDSLRVTLEEPTERVMANRAENLHERTYDALATALSPLGLEWTVEVLMARLTDAGAFSQNS